MFAASSVMSAFAVGRGSSYARGVVGGDWVLCKRFTGPSAALCIAAIVPLAAEDGHGAIDHAFESERMMLFTCVAVVPTVASVWLSGKAMRPSGECSQE